MTSRFERAADLQRILSAEAERLLAERARRAPPQRGAVNQHFNERPPQPTRDQAEQDAFTRALIGRLAVRDRTGAGSGGAG